MKEDIRKSVRSNAIFINVAIWVFLNYSIKGSFDSCESFTLFS